MERLFSKAAAVAAVFCAAVVLAVSAAPSSSGKDQGKSDGQGHVLVSMWKEYGNLKKQDRPDKEASVLKDIISVAEKRHLPWDFYDGWRKYRDTELSRDWKMRSHLDSAMSASIREFDEPVVTYRRMLDEMAYARNNDTLISFARKNASRLKAASNPMFYRTGYRNSLSSRYFAFPSSVAGSISDDYEYVLWSALACSGAVSSPEIWDMLSSYISGSYPGGAYLDFYRIMTLCPAKERHSALEKYAVSHAGEAVSLFAGQELINEEFARLQASEEVSSEDYLALREKCRQFEASRKKFTGTDKKIADDCDAVESLINVLDGQSIRIDGAEDTLHVQLRNIGGFSMEIRAEGQDSVLYSADFVNGKKSYFIYDTVSVAFPVPDDGDYTVSCSSGEIRTASLFGRRSVSLAYRRDGEGIAVYAADRKSGRPLENADIEIYRKDTLVDSFRNLKFDGFVHLDADFSSAPGGGRPGCRMVCSFKDRDGASRKSTEVYLGYPYGVAVAPDAGMVYGVILKDRAVFRQGDTLAFKTVLYERNPSGSASGYSVLGAGKKAEMVLYGPGKTGIDTLALALNDFGSASGAFRIPEDGLGGRYSIDVLYNGHAVASSYFVVGDVDIPSFDLEFEPCDTIYLPGDSIVVSGRLHSYSGHNLDEADMRWTVYGGRSGRISGAVCPDEQGRFSFGFRDSTSADMSSYYNIMVRVTDATGETLEFNDNVTVAPMFSLDVIYDNPAEGSVSLSEKARFSPMTGYGAAVMDGDKADIRFVVRNSDWEQTSYPQVAYSVCKGDATIFEGHAMSGEVVTVDLSGYGSGLYRLKAEAEVDMKMPDGRDSSIVCRYSYDLVKMADDADSLDFDADYFFKKAGSGNDIAMLLGSTGGPVWAVVELWGGDKGDMPLRSELVCFGGSRGSEESLVTVRFPFEDAYPDDVRLSVFYFKNGDDRRYSAEYHRNTSDMALPVDFVSFTGSAQPGETVTMTVKVSPSAESAVTVFDAASEQIMSNGWGPVWLWSEIPEAYIYAYNGVNFSRAVLSRSDGNMLFKNSGIAAMAPDAAVTLEESAVVQNYAGSASVDLEIRDEFDNTLAFIPFLKSGPDSTVTFSFRTSGKVSTYKVSVFSHDKEMRSNTVSREFIVTKPVMVSVSAPGFLHEGDRYVFRGVVSNSSGQDTEGVLSLHLYDNENYEDSVPMMVCSRPVALSSGKRVSEDFVVEVPDSTDILGFKLVFEGGPAGTDSFGKMPGEDSVWSDGMFVSVPVYPDVQQLVEAHSAVLLPGMDLDSLKSALAEEFVNTLPYGAYAERISLIDMILKAVPEKAEIKGKDVVSLSDALYVRMLCGCLPGGNAVDELVKKILDCQNPDGGFGWFAGMNSSAGITALLLERISELRGRAHTGIVDDAVVEKALGFLDKEMLGAYSGVAGTRFSGISLPEYLYVRSMYVSVPLAEDAVKASAGHGADSSRKPLAAFRKDVVKYMTAPTGSAVFDGRLLDKARRAFAAMNLLENGDSALAGGFGLKKGKLRKISRTLYEDMASICSYAVEHPSGGMYFPNAVMSRYGLLESELYAHTVICDLLSRYAGSTAASSDKSSGDAGWGRKDSAELSGMASGIADGVRLWMMIQKETQQWDDDPAFVHAIASVLDGSEKLLGTEIVILSKKYEKPFEEIKASGNGFKVTRQYFREKAPDEKGISRENGGDKSRGEKNSGGEKAGGKIPVPVSYLGQSGEILEEIGEGDTLAVGDRLVCRYTVWSGENRSFVKLTVPRNPAMRPADQISGMTGWWRRPLLSSGFATSGSWNPVPRGYRNVESDKTVYYFDVFPEETTVIEEVFFVTQGGEFSSAIPEVECVYAPHYRANAGFDGRMAVE